MIKKLGFKGVLLFVLFSSLFCYAGSVSLTVTEKIKKERPKLKPEKSNHITVKTKVLISQSTLTIKLANFGESGSFQLEWYFFEQVILPSGKKGDFKIFEKGKESISLDKKAKTKKEVKSQEVKSTEKKTEKYNSSRHDKGNSSQKSCSGSIYKGYVVLVRQDGKIVAKKASSPKFLKKEWMEKLVQ